MDFLVEIGLTCTLRPQNAAAKTWLKDASLMVQGTWEGDVFVPKRGLLKSLLEKITSVNMHFGYLCWVCSHEESLHCCVFPWARNSSWCQCQCTRLSASDLIAIDTLQN